MKSSIAISWIAALAASADATVYLGLRTGIDGSQASVAWTNGTPDLCSGYSVIVDANTNPCDHEFYVDGNNGPYQLKGCGGNGLTLFSNGQFNSNCKYEDRTVNCNGGASIKQDWACF
ncbi:hypothetical protein GGR51DRAFT_499649 [Nemania sp. FL0031]|nr:hypothetical protein GGR51DRAFT_499649 [Nemania sp. FL0031]